MLRNRQKTSLFRFERGYFCSFVKHRGYIWSFPLKTIIYKVFDRLIWENDLLAHKSSKDDRLLYNKCQNEHKY